MFFSPYNIAITSLMEELILVLFYVRFVLVKILSVSSSSWCLGSAAVCDCGTPWTFLLPFCSAVLVRNCVHSRVIALIFAKLCLG